MVWGVVEWGGGAGEGGGREGREGMYVCASCLQVVEWGGGAGAHASAQWQSIGSARGNCAAKQIATREIIAMVNGRVGWRVVGWLVGRLGGWADGWRWWLGGWVAVAMVNG